MKNDYLFVFRQKNIQFRQISCLNGSKDSLARVFWVFCAQSSMAYDLEVFTIRIFEEAKHELSKLYIDKFVLE